MDAEDAGIGEAPVEGVDRVAEPALLAHFLEEARGHAAADDRGEYLARVEVRRTVRQTLETHHDLGFHLVAHLARVATEIGGRQRRRTGLGADVAEALLAHGDELVVTEVAGRGDDHGRPAIVATQVRIQHRRSGGLHRLRRAEDGAPDRLVGKGAGGEEVEDAILGRIERRADLLQDDMLLAFQLRRVEDRVAQDVGEDVEGERHVVLEDPGIVGGGLDAGRGIDLAADRLDLLGDVDGRAGIGTLEGHVLEEMRQAVLAFALGTRAGADPDAERRAFEMRHFVGDDAETGFEARDADGHELRPSRPPRGRGTG